MEEKSKTIAKMLKATKREVTDFQYVVQRPRKAKICFGSGQERVKFRAVSRHGIQHSTSTLGPGLYDQSCIERICPVSNKGTVIGGRTADLQQPSLVDERSPGPAKYDVPSPEPENISRFLSCPRFRPEPGMATVGPGYYSVSSPHKTLKYTESFGGRRSLTPAVRMKCGPYNSDVCELCDSSPEGDYWHLTVPTASYTKYIPKLEYETWYLCRKCYLVEKRKPSRFTRQQLLAFKKIRDCSKVHFHDGCEARLLLLPPRDMDKIREKEAYLSLYFPEVVAATETTKKYVDCYTIMSVQKWYKKIFRQLTLRIQVMSHKEMHGELQ